MSTIKIFLASSAELKEDRLSFKSFIADENNFLSSKGVFLYLELWEDFIDAMSATRLQDEYNKAIEECDIFIMLFSAKVGKYTAEEFEKAFQKFKETNKPYIYTYFKNSNEKVGNLTRENMESLWDFQDRLKNLGHFQTEYDSVDRLHLHFKRQLEKLNSKGFVGITVSEKVPELTIKIPECLSVGMPPAALYFVGRNIEIADIKEKLNQHSLLLINAEGGMGKTSLAAKYLEDNISNYTHYAWLFCDDGIIVQLKTLATPLGIDLTLYPSEEEKLLMIKQELEKLGKKCLLILDNANESEEIEHLKEHFSGLHTHILITSRCHNVLPKEKEYTLNHLEPEIAKQLFKGYYDEKAMAFEALLDKFLIAVGYNTLMIELFGRSLHQLSALGETLESILKRFEKEGLYLGNKSFEIQTAYTGITHKQVASSDDIISLIYDHTRLEELERHMLVNIAVLPAESHLLEILFEAFVPEDNIAFTKLLKNLVKSGWLSTDTHSYRMNPVIQQLVLAKNKNRLYKDTGRLIYNLTKKLEHVNGFLVNLRNYQDAQIFAVMAQSLSELLLDESFEHGMLVFNLSDYYRGTGNFILSLRELKIAASIFEKIDKVNYSACLQRMGDIYRQQGDFKKAIQFFEKYNELRKELVEVNPRSELFKNELAISYSKLGEIYEQQDDLKKALQFFEKYNELRTELIETNPNNQSFKNELAISYSKLGGIYEQQNGFKIALHFFEKYNELRKELVGTNPHRESLKYELAISFEKLGDIYEKLKDFKNSIRVYQQETKLIEELIKANPDSVLLQNVLAISFTKLAKVYKEMQELKKVKENYLKAESIWIKLTEKVPEAFEFAKNLTLVKNQLTNL